MILARAPLIALYFCWAFQVVLSASSDTASTVTSGWAMYDAPSSTDTRSTYINPRRAASDTSEALINLVNAAALAQRFENINDKNNVSFLFINQNFFSSTSTSTSASISKKGKKSSQVEGVISSESISGTISQLYEDFTSAYYVKNLPVFMNSFCKRLYGEPVEHKVLDSPLFNKIKAFKLSFSSGSFVVYSYLTFNESEDPKIEIRMKLSNQMTSLFPSSVPELLEQSTTGWSVIFELLEKQENDAPAISGIKSSSPKSSGTIAAEPTTLTGKRREKAQVQPVEPAELSEEQRLAIMEELINGESAQAENPEKSKNRIKKEKLKEKKRAEEAAAAAAAEAERIKSERLSQSERDRKANAEKVEAERKQKEARALKLLEEKRVRDEKNRKAREEEEARKAAVKKQEEERAAAIKEEQDRLDEIEREKERLAAVKKQEEEALAIAAQIEQDRKAAIAAQNEQDRKAAYEKSKARKAAAKLAKQEERRAAAELAAQREQNRILTLKMEQQQAENDLVAEFRRKAAESEKESERLREENKRMLAAFELMQMSGGVKGSPINTAASTSQGTGSMLLSSPAHQDQYNYFHANTSPGTSVSSFGASPNSTSNQSISKSSSSPPPITAANPQDSLFARVAETDRSFGNNRRLAPNNLGKPLVFGAQANLNPVPEVPLISSQQKLSPENRPFPPGFSPLPVQQQQQSGYLNQQAGYLHQQQEGYLNQQQPFYHRYSPPQQQQQPQIQQNYYPQQSRQQPTQLGGFLHGNSNFPSPHQTYQNGPRSVNSFSSQNSAPLAHLNNYGSPASSSSSINPLNYNPSFQNNEQLFSSSHDSLGLTGSGNEISNPFDLGFNPVLENAIHRSPAQTAADDDDSADIDQLLAEVFKNAN